MSGGISNDENESVKIEGNTDGTFIGNESDRLKVNVSNPGGLPISPVPDLDLQYQVIDLLNGSNNNMAINGSSTPVIFKYAPAPGEVLHVSELQIYLSDNGTIVEGGFGSGIALTNGMLIDSEVNSTITTFYNVQNNTDLSLTFRISPERSQFLTDKNFIGFRVFDPAIILTGDNNDEFRVTIRDNLSGLNLIRATLFAWKAIL